jgi:lipid A 4'-phosphatase
LRQPHRRTVAADIRAALNPALRQSFQTPHIATITESFVPPSASGPDVSHPSPSPFRAAHPSPPLSAPAVHALRCVLKRADIRLFMATVLLFSLFPALDPAFSALFFDPVSRTFIGRDIPFDRFVYVATPVIGWLSFALVSGLALYFLATAPQLRRLAHARRSLFLLAVLVAGPGFGAIVLKDHWGRGRPIHVEQFGGTAHFTPALLPADQCHRNCSFVSGHAATAFCFMAFAWVFPRRRRLLFSAGLALGATVGLVRIMQGAHFLSDVLFSGWMIYGVCCAVAFAMDRRGRWTGTGA